MQIIYLIYVRESDVIHDRSRQRKLESLLYTSDQIKILNLLLFNFEIAPIN